MEPACLVAKKMATDPSKSTNSAPHASSSGAHLVESGFGLKDKKIRQVNLSLCQCGTLLCQRGTLLVRGSCPVSASAASPTLSLRQPEKMSSPFSEDPLVVRLVVQLVCCMAGGERNNQPSMGAAKVMDRTAAGKG